MTRIKTNIKLRRWQIEAIEIWRESKNRGIVSVATGGGKTIFAIQCACNLFAENKIKLCFIITPTITLVDQWYVNLLNATNFDKEEISTKLSNKAKVIILTNIKAQQIISKIQSTGILVIYDECHRYGTKNNLKIFNSLNYTLGLTATIERKYDDGVNNILIPNIGQVIYNYNLEDAIKDGVVLKYKLINIRTFFNISEEAKYNEINNKIRKIYSKIENNADPNQDIAQKQLDILIFRRKRIINETSQRELTATKIIIENINKKKIVFCETIEQCNRIKTLCKHHGLDVLTYHSKMSQKERISILHSYYNNFYHTLIGCRALDEGFDVPDITMGIIVSQTNTNRQRIQRLGRTVRYSKGKTQPIIYTLYTTDDEEKNLIKENKENNIIDVEWIEIIK